MKTKPSASVIGEDPDATAELPVADFAPASDDTSDAGLATDVFPVPAIQVGNSELAERLREVEQRLHRRSERVRQLEKLLNEVGEQQALLETRLAQALERQAELETQLQEARAQAQQQSQLVFESRAAAARHQTEEFMEIRGRSERQLEALTSWQGFRAVSDALLADAEARNTLLESQLSALMQSSSALQDERARAVPGDGGNEALRTELAELQSEFATLQSELLVAQERRQQSAPKTEVEAAHVHHLDAEQPQWELVRQGKAGGRVYPIGRRTTIGRTPDNDIQIDVHNVSRHHAVLLTSADHCLVEDLNSTNGVLVNGRRVIRQVLREGDTVKIGKTEFKYRLRS